MPISNSNATYGNDQSAVSDIISQAGVNGALTVGTSAVEIKVGASVLENRKSITLFNNSNSTLYWGYSNSVTTSNGTPIFKNQTVQWGVGSEVSIWIIAGSIGNDTRITEGS